VVLFGTEILEIGADVTTELSWVFLTEFVEDMLVCVDVLESEGRSVVSMSEMFEIIGVGGDGDFRAIYFEWVGKVEQLPNLRLSGLLRT